jgi:hypothetical protein
MNEQLQKVYLLFIYIPYFCFSVPTDLHEPDVLGFFESLEKEKAQAEMAKMLKKKKLCPIAPDGKLF